MSPERDPEAEMVSNTFFSSIAALEGSRLTEAVYQVLLVLRHRGYLDTESMNVLLDMASRPNLVDPDGSLRPIVLDAVHSVEVAKNKPLRNISDQELAKFRDDLWELPSSQSRRERGAPQIPVSELMKRLDEQSVYS